MFLFCKLSWVMKNGFWQVSFLQGLLVKYLLIALPHFEKCFFLFREQVLEGFFFI